MPALETPIPVNPSMLRWAREDAGFSLVEAAMQAKLAGCRATKERPGIDPAERLGMLERGELGVTRNLLATLSKLYRRPEIFFFLSKPPHKKDLLLDYRTVGSVAPQDSPEFAALKRRVVNIQRSLKQLAEEQNSPPLPFVGTINLFTSVKVAVECIRAVIGGDLRKSRRTWSADAYFKELRKKVHEAGVFVILIGDLGSHHSKIPVEIFRGMAISCSRAPIIVINPNDAVTGRIFTLIHELCHVLLGVSVISNSDVPVISKEARQEEQFCHAVAAEFLVPAEDLAKENFGDKAPPVFDTLGKQYGVSAAVIARRARDLKLISNEDFNKVTPIFMARRPKERSGQPNPNVTAKSYLGDKLVSTLVGAAYEGKIDISDAVYLLNLSTSRIEKIYQ